MSGLIWIQTVWHPDGIEKMQHPKTGKVKYGSIIKCKGIIKAILENPKTARNTLFCNYVIFEPHRLHY